MIGTIPSKRELIPCDVCGTPTLFFVAESWKVCDPCWRSFTTERQETGISYWEWRKHRWIQILLS